MKKLLIRTGLNPHDVVSPANLIERDLIGTNSGNMIYAHSLYRNLTTENCVLEADKYVINPDNADFINENYDGYIFALADAFRQDFIWQIKKMTQLVKKLTIPVYLIGAGIRASYDVVPEELHFDFDDDVREFIAAVLEKSNMVGLRGQITAQYLTNLGFREGIDHIAIGCPSMYTYGENLSIRRISDIDKESKISTNMSKPAAPHVLEYIHNLHHEYENASFLPQGYDEFSLLYTGLQNFKTKTAYPDSFDDVEYSSGNAKFFLNPTTWIDFMKTLDFSFGTKLHGNITATIAGTPSITIPLDARMKELVDYHDLSAIRPENIDSSKSLNDLIETVDLYSVEGKQKENYQKFTQFLEKNGLDYVYQDASNHMKTPYDALVKDIELYPMIETVDRTNLKSLNEHFEGVVLGNSNRIKNMRGLIKNQRTQIQKKDKELSTQANQIKLNDNQTNTSQLEKENLIKEINALKAKNDYLEATLERKLIRVARGFSDKIASFKSK